MKTIKLASASRPLAEYAKELDEQIVLVTERDRPIAAFVAGAEAMIKTFRSLADGPETEVALHQLGNRFPVGDVQVFATNGAGRTGIQELSAPVFRW